MLRKFLNSKTGIDALPSVLTLFIMIIIISLLIAFFFSTNSSLQKQMNTESEQAKEQISIINIGINSNQILTNITIQNSGSTEVIIRALYREQDGLTNLIVDPHLPIAQGTSQTIDLTSLGLTLESDSRFMATTQRGTKSMAFNEVQINYREYKDYTNSSTMAFGPLLLTFDSLNWAPVDASGNIGTWDQTWTIPTGTCAWRFQITNIDSEERNITLTKYSGFSLSLVGSPSTTTWYMNDLQKTVDFNTTSTFVFYWNSDRTATVSAGSNQKGVNNVFLTLFGNYSDGKSLGQTIPFEAITVI